MGKRKAPKGGGSIAAKSTKQKLAEQKKGDPWCCVEAYLQVLREAREAGEKLGSLQALVRALARTPRQGEGESLRTPCVTAYYY